MSPAVEGGSYGSILSKGSKSSEDITVPNYAIKGSRMFRSNNDVSTSDIKREQKEKPCRTYTNSSSMSINYLVPPVPQLRQSIILSTLQLNQEVAEGKTSVRLPLTLKQKSLVGMLVFANISMAVVYSCIGPFFPGEAHKKGASQTEVGLIFGIFELARCLSAPIHGKIMPYVGAKFMYNVGLTCTATCLILFGLLEYSPSGGTFVGLCFAVRVTEAVFAAMLVTASFSITAHEFPDRVAFIFGFLETGMGLGYAIGPPIGGFLYQLGGFKLPFFVLGGLLFLAGLISIPLVPKQKSNEKMAVGGIFGLLKIPLIIVMCLTASSISLIFGFYDSAFQIQLQSFNLTPLVVGLLFLVLAATYACCAPIIGMIVDRHQKIVPCMMLTGCIIIVIGMLFLGPAPFFGIQKSIASICVSSVMLGFGISMTFIPTFPTALFAAKENGYPDDFHTFGAVSGLFQAAFSFGAFVGPIVLGGLATENLGFAWSCVIDSGWSLFVAILLVFWCINKFVRTGDSESDLDPIESDLGKLDDICVKQPFLTQETT